MKPRLIAGLSTALILVTGITHLYVAPVEWIWTPYVAILFSLSFVGSVVAATGVYRGLTWGWVLGIAVSACCLAGYVLSRTVGLPGHAVEPWFHPVGVIAGLAEAGFVAMFVVGKGWQGITSVGVKRWALLPAASLALATALAVAVLYGSSQNPADTALSPGQHGASHLHALHAVHISNEELAETYGVEVRLVALSMMDGVVDVRFRVLDADKASKLLDNHENLPALLVGDGEVELSGWSHMAHHINYKTGRTYSMLYTNAKRTIHDGTPVSVTFGHLRLDPVPVRGS